MKKVTIPPTIKSPTPTRPKMIRQLRNGQELANYLIFLKKKKKISNIIIKKNEKLCPSVLQLSI